jgi:hypothetical protein
MPFEKGHKLSKGRPTKAQEAKAYEIMVNGLKVFYNVETEEEAKIQFLKETLMSSQRGQLFIAEHIFGKPKETIDQNVTLHDFKVSDLIKFKGD